MTAYCENATVLIASCPTACSMSLRRGVSALHSCRRRLDALSRAEDFDLPHVGVPPVLVVAQHRQLHQVGAQAARRVDRRARRLQPHVDPPRRLRQLQRAHLLNEAGTASATAFRRTRHIQPKRAFMSWMLLPTLTATALGV